jgi:hypothetical protein
LSWCGEDWSRLPTADRRAPELKGMAAVALGVSVCTRQRQSERNEKSWN